MNKIKKENNAAVGKGKVSSKGKKINKMCCDEEIEPAARKELISGRY